MRAIAFALLVACGGGDKDKDKDKAAALDHEVGAAKIREFTKQLCACRSKECAQQVNGELEAWTKNFARQTSGREATEAPVAVQNQVAEDLNRYSRCLMNLTGGPKQ